MKREIECLYSCDECGVKKQPVAVPAREDGVDFGVWLREVAIFAIMADHNARSPRCRPKTLSELAIPVFDENEPIGSVPRSN